MTTYSLFPSYVVLEYHSLFGIHTMTIPIRQWTATGVDLGNTLDWDDNPIDLLTMVNQLVGFLAAAFPSTVNFDVATVFNFPSEDDDPNPVASVVLDVPGTSISTAWSKAVQQTFTFRTANFNIFKLVLLDVPTDNNFDRVPASAFATIQNNIVSALSDDSNGWSGRDNSQIMTPIQASATLNEKLRREYHMF